MERKLYFFGGKGGTGKTSLSSAFALMLARRGKKVLAVSTDPAHSLADAFDTTLSDSPTQLEQNLFALEVDASAEARRYVDGIRERMKDLVSPAIVEDLNRQLDQSAASPGSEESALLDRFSTIMTWAGKDYDAIVFDTAPTGHTLRLLELPEALGLWMTHLMNKRQKAMDLIRHASHYETDLKNQLRDDPLFETLSRRRTQFYNARTVLTDPQVTTFFLVMAAEKMPLLETGRAVTRLSEAHIPLGPVVINKVLPQETGPYFETLRAKQAQWIAKAQDQFKNLGTLIVPWMAQDVENATDLANLATHITDLA